MASLAEGLSLRFYIMVFGLHLRNSYKWIVATILKSSNMEHAPPLQNILLHTELPMRFLRAGMESYLLCTVCLVQGLLLNGHHINVGSGTSLVAQWLRHCASNAGGSGSIPGWGTENPHDIWASLSKHKPQRDSVFKRNSQRFTFKTHQSLLTKIPLHKLSFVKPSVHLIAQSGLG